MRKSTSKLRLRDYKAEYQRRLEKGLSKGKSKSAARGHARAEDLGRLPPGPIDRDNTYERALKSLKQGNSLRSAAKFHGMSEEKLRRYVKRATEAQRIGSKWVIFDTRPQPVFIISNGELRTVIVALDDASDVGKYHAAVNRFLATNDIDHLFQFEGEGVYDVNGKFHRFETRPNILRKLDSVGEINFLTIYADVAK